MSHCWKSHVAPHINAVIEDDKVSTDDLEENYRITGLCTKYEYSLLPEDITLFLTDPSANIQFQIKHITKQFI